RPPDWDRYRNTISDLYSTSELKKAIKAMRDIHNFKASENQYKKQIAKWGLDTKRIKGTEYKAMLKKKRKRESDEPGKLSQFFLCGQRVPSPNITRYKERMLKCGKITETD
ncbi:hypothetical protein K469DRAFT_536359, partial [Zopfia rhizophila CBS 207.26]